MALNQRNIFPSELKEMERVAAELFNAEQAYEKAAALLYSLYQCGYGTAAERDAAVDYLEDALLIPRRERDKFGIVR